MTQTHHRVPHNPRETFYDNLAHTIWSASLGWERGIKMSVKILSSTMKIAYHGAYVKHSFSDDDAEKLINELHQLHQIGHHAERAEKIREHLIAVCCKKGCNGTWLREWIREHADKRERK